MVRILSPRPAVQRNSAELAQPLESLQGRVLGLRIQWDNFEMLLDHVVGDPGERGRPRAVKRWKTAPEKGRHTRTDAEHREREFAAFVDEVDAAILGLAA